MNWKRGLPYALPPLVSLAVFWRVPFMWFRIDDFAWLGLSQQVHGLGDLLRALFEPQAQGTVRFLSERGLFLVLGGVFGLHAWPFRVVALATWIACLWLIQKIGSQLTGSPAAGLLAALLWSVSAVVTVPLAWASSYNELLCALCVLGAFYSRLRWLDTGESKWRWREAIAYLAGFGALEVIVVYPAIVLLHALTDRAARSAWRSALWMYLPAGIFAAVHFFLIPRDASPVYQVIVDARLPANLLRYIGWTVGPSDFDLIDVAWQPLALAVTWASGLMLLAFVVRQLVRREMTVLFFCGWFFLLLAPTLPLPNHVSPYYLTIPGIGLAWAAGWGLVSAARIKRRAGLAMVMLASALAIAYGIGSVAEVQSLTSWHLRVTSRLRILMRGVEQSAAAHPGQALVLQGVDDELFRGGFRDDPFRLVGLREVFLAPGNADQILALPEFEMAGRFRTSREKLLPLLEADKARVLNVAENAVRDVTRAYRAVLRAEVLGANRGLVEVGDPAFASRLGEGWHPVENGARWMARRATVKLGGGAKLVVSGFGAEGALAGGPLELRASVGGKNAGVFTVKQVGGFVAEFSIPGAMAGAYALDVVLECSRTFRPPGDSRELGIVVRRVEVR